MSQNNQFLLTQILALRFAIKAMVLSRPNKKLLAEYILSGLELRTKSSASPDHGALIGYQHSIFWPNICITDSDRLIKLDIERMFSLLGYI